MLQKDSIVVVLRTDCSYVRVEKAWLVWYAGESHTAKVVITMLGTIDEAMVRVSRGPAYQNFIRISFRTTACDPCDVLKFRFSMLRWIGGLSGSLRTMIASGGCKRYQLSG